MANEKELDDFTKDELLAMAEEFGVEVKSSQRKDAIIAAFEADGVTVELIQGFKPDTEDDLKEAGLHPLAAGEELATAPVVEAPAEEELVLVVMQRRNYTYEIRGHKFTREHPYRLVNEADADFLIEVDGGFRMASPKEARAYYS